ncbi:YdcF family protein [Mangrovimicrobium sediminis]|uniref:YdcF family protein n=1 Tax=Mangrovimicrobium sediminis TaxID=2562682 RepID=UPI001F0FCB55|nr:YdcF family protein [Haliea sp. SAOS-164]
MSDLSYATTKLLSLLAYPLNQALLLLLVALLAWRWRRLAFTCCALGVAWLYLCSTAWFADLVMGSLEDRYPPRALSALPEADAIVVLGGATRGDGHLGSMADLNQQADRLTHAAALYQAGKAPLVLLSGGSGTGGRPEAEQMAEFMTLMGVPADALLLERASRDTHENAVYSAILLQSRQVRTVLLVTSAFHMPRAVPLFRREGFEVIPAPTDFQRLADPPVVPRLLPTVDDLQRTTQGLREYVGTTYYSLRSWF